MPVIVDTNVPLAANGKSDADDECLLACTRAISNIIDDGHIVLDDDWRIIGEYLNKLSPRWTAGNRRQVLEMGAHQSKKSRALYSGSHHAAERKL